LIFLLTFLFCNDTFFEHLGIEPQKLKGKGGFQMKRLIVVLVILVFIAAIPLSHSLRAKPMSKYMICHITGEDEGILTGHIIIVSGNAVPAHYAHGDHDPACDERKAGDYCWRPKPPYEPTQNYKCPVEK
jgi:hypothetical protein